MCKRRWCYRHVKYHPVAAKAIHWVTIEIRHLITDENTTISPYSFGNDIEVDVGLVEGRRQKKAGLRVDFKYRSAPRLLFKNAGQSVCCLASFLDINTPITSIYPAI